MPVNVYIGGAAKTSWVRPDRRRRRKAAGVEAPPAAPAATGRLLHDATSGPARNPSRQRCSSCGKRAKFCRC